SPLTHKFRVTCLCEPQLGKRGLVPTMSSKETYQETLAMKDVLAYADGTHDIEGLAEVIEQPVEVVEKVVDQLLSAGLLEVSHGDRFPDSPGAGESGNLSPLTQKKDKEVTDYDKRRDNGKSKRDIQGCVR
ncbi:MAG: hypothetical protein IJT80_04290, partial [Lachnospiraceae bacterium]|nr:hypothetical protein [Lachnospiraceae bacterium]